MELLFYYLERICAIFGNAYVRSAIHSHHSLGRETGRNDGLAFDPHACDCDQTFLKLSIIASLSLLGCFVQVSVFDFVCIRCRGAF